MNKASSKLFGYFLIFIGTGFLLEQFGIIASFGNMIAKLWPLLLVYWGYKTSQKGKFVLAGVLVGIGILLLGSAWFEIDFWGVFWPTILIVIGLLMLTGKNKQKSGKRGDIPTDKIDQNIFFTESDVQLTSKNFEGGEVNCFFAQADLDLSEIKLSGKEEVLEVNCFFGQTRLKLPKKLPVSVSSTEILGEWVNEYEMKEGKKGNRLKIKGTVGFGRVEVFD